MMHTFHLIIILVSFTDFIFELSITTCPPCLYGFEKKQEMTSLLLAELYRMRCVCIGRVAFVLAVLLCICRACPSFDSDRFCHINTVILIAN